MGGWGGRHERPRPAHVLSMDVMMTTGLEVGSHAADCWKHVFRYGGGGGEEGGGRRWGGQGGRGAGVSDRGRKHCWKHVFR